MSMRTLTPIAIALFAWSICTFPAFGQAPPTKGELLQNIQDVEQLDPELEQYLPRWRVREADLKIKLAQILKLEGFDVTPADSFVVTATFPKSGRQDILVIRAGGSPDAALSGKDRIYISLGDRLYNEILARNYEHQAIEPATPITQRGPERVASVLNPTTAKQFVALSAFRQAVQLGTTGARLEHLLGNDEIGYHFWSSGQGKAVVHYPIIPLADPKLRANGVPDVLTIMLGVAYRMKFGNDGNSLFGDAISPRKLNGSLGSKAVTRIEYRLPEINDIGFFLHTEIPFNKIPTDTIHVSREGLASAQEIIMTRNTETPFTRYYFLRTVAQGAVFWETWLNDYEHFFRISIGASYQEFLKMNDSLSRGKDSSVSTAKLKPMGLIHNSEVQDWVYAKVEYLNQSGFPFGLSAQLANRNLLVSGFIPVIPNWLFLEAKFSTPILRDTTFGDAGGPWETRPFFMISPILRFKIDN